MHEIRKSLKETLLGVYLSMYVCIYVYTYYMCVCKSCLKGSEEDIVRVCSLMFSQGILGDFQSLEVMCSLRYDKLCNLHVCSFAE